MFYVVSIEVCNAGETREVVFVLEAGYPSLTALAEALRADGFIEGHRHNTRFGEGRRREVKGPRVQCLVTRQSIRQVTEMTETLISASGDVLFDGKGAADAA